jgi:hypothetical protein
MSSSSKFPKIKSNNKEHDNLMSRSSVISALVKDDYTLHSSISLIDGGKKKKNIKKKVKKGGDYSVDPTSITNYEGYNYYIGGNSNVNSSNLGINYILNSKTSLMQGGIKNKKKIKSKSKKLV